MGNILIFAGSSREGSVNKKLAACAAQAVEAAGGRATLVDLADHPAPVYDGDLEAASGLPAGAQSFKELLGKHDAFFIISPEYNGHVPPLLVNLLGWASRPQGDEASCAVFTGKPVAVGAASPGGLGGVRVIPRLRDFMAELGAVPVPGFVTLPGAYGAFSETGALTNEKTARTLAAMAASLLAAARR